MTELLSPLGQKIFDNALYPMTFKKGEVIFREKEHVDQVKLIEQGLVKLSHNQTSGKPLIIELLDEGNFIELSSVFNGRTHEVSAIALENTLIHSIDIQTFFTIYYNNTSFNEEINRKMAGSNKFLLNQLVARTIKRLPGRVADVILYLYELNKKSLTFNVPLTRIEMAQLAGTTKESLIRTLTEFKNDKIINLDGRNLTIVSLEIIQTLSRFG